MRVAITGASGFIGKALYTQLGAAGIECASVDMRKPTLSMGGAGAVVHLAAIAHQKHARANEVLRTNVELAVRAGEAAASAGARMIFVSSVKVHGEESHGPFNEASRIAPENAYAESKARAEEALHKIADLRLTVLRPPLVYGPAVKANFYSLMTAVARGWPLPFAGLNNRRSLVYVGNVCDFVRHCIETPRSEGQAYLLSDGPVVSTAELCRRLGLALGRPARLFPFPRMLLPRKLAGSLEIDDSKARMQLGWQPRFSMDTGFRITADWYRAS